MTVQQLHPSDTASTTVRLPVQRRADHDDVPAARSAAAPAAAPLARGWGSQEDRVMVRYLFAFMTSLGLFIALMLVIGIDVWG